MTKKTSNGLKRTSDEIDKRFVEGMKKIDKKFEDLSKRGIKDIKVK